MAGYTKLFSSILASTIWREDNNTRIVWITLLAMADRDGLVETSVPGLADFARLPLHAVRTSLKKLESPDKDSRSKESEGRRIEPRDGGWFIINHAKYRAKMGADERRDYNRVKQAEYRRRKTLSLTVNENDGCVDNTEAEADPKAEAKAEAETTQSATPPTVLNPHSKPTNLINGSELRIHGTHAWCSWPTRDGLCVPAFLHRELIGKHGGLETSGATLKAWYPTVVARHAGTAIGDDALDFWRNEFAAWVGTVTSKPRALTPLQEAAKRHRVVR